MSHNIYWQQAMEHLKKKGEFETFTKGAQATFDSLSVRAEYLTGIVSTSLAMLSDLTGYKQADIEIYLSELEERRVITRLTLTGYSEYALHPRMYEEYADVEVIN